MGYKTGQRLNWVPSTGRLADSHFLAREHDGFAARPNDDRFGQAAPAVPDEHPGCRFSVFRADSVSVTSTRFAGGDWRWRLCDRGGKVLVEAGGYRSEAHCRAAVSVLQGSAAHATMAESRLEP